MAVITDPDLIAKLNAAAGIKAPAAAAPPVPATRVAQRAAQGPSYRRRSQESIDAETAAGAPVVPQTPGARPVRADSGVTPRGSVVSDPKMVQELNDRQKAKELGYDYDKISQSRDAKIAKEATGSIFPAVGKGFSGGKTSGFLKGLFRDPGDAVTQFALHAGSDIEKGLGIDTKGGVFSDEQIAYQEAAHKASEREYEEGRKRQGRSGFDAARLAGNIVQPYIPGGGAAKGLKAIGKAGLQGAAGGVLEQTDLKPGENYYSKKAGEAGAGLIFGGALGTAGRAVAGAGSLVRPSKLAGPDLRAARDAAKRLNVDVGLANITRSRPLARAADISASLPFGGRLIRGAQTAEKGLGEALEGTAAGFGGTARTRGEVGQTVAEGIKGHVERFKDEGNRMFAEVDKYAPQAIEPSNTLGAMRNTMTKFMNPKLGRSLANTRLLQFANDISTSPNGPHRLEFSDAQALRSEIGSMMSSPSLVSDIPQGELKQVYKALTKDMRDGLERTGDPRALQAFDDAANHWKQGRHVIDNVLDKIQGGGTLSHEKIADRILTMGSNDAEGLTHLRNSLTDEEWDNVASGTFHRLGEIRPGTGDYQGEGFNPGKFLENYQRVKKNGPAFDALFGGTRYADNIPRYDDMALLSERLKGNQKLANHSGTSLSNNIVTMVMGLANPVVWKGVGASNVFARAMSSPKFLDWYLGTGRRLNRASSIPGRLGKRAIEAAAKVQYARLAGMAAHDSGMAEVLASLAGNQPQPQQ